MCINSSSLTKQLVIGWQLLFEFGERLKDLVDEYWKYGYDRGPW